MILNIENHQPLNPPPPQPQPKKEGLKWNYI